MKKEVLVGMLLSWTAIGCGGGGGGSSPAAPTPAATATPAAPADVTGTWGEARGGDLTWVLTQSGSSVTGTSNFSQNNSPNLGAASGQGVITGSVSGTTFTFTDTYARLSPRQNCSLTVSGQMTVTGTAMSGRYTETDICDGLTLGTINETLSMSRR